MHHVRIFEMTDQVILDLTDEWKKMFPDGWVESREWAFDSLNYTFYSGEPATGNKFSLVYLS